MRYTARARTLRMRARRRRQRCRDRPAASNGAAAPACRGRHAAGACHRGRSAPADRLWRSRGYQGAQNGSPALTSCTGTSGIKVLIHCAISSMPASSETAWPSIIQPLAMPRAAASSTYSGLSRNPSTSCCSPLMTTSMSVLLTGRRRVSHSELNASHACVRITDNARWLWRRAASAQRRRAFPASSRAP